MKKLLPLALILLSGCATMSDEKRMAISQALSATGAAMIQNSVNQSSGCTSPLYATSQPRINTQRTINGYTVACDAYARQPLVWVNPYVRNDGRMVCGHWRTLPDSSLSNNLGCS